MSLSSAETGSQQEIKQELKRSKQELLNIQKVLNKSEADVNYFRGNNLKFKHLLQFLLQKPHS